VPTVQQKKYF